MNYIILIRLIKNFVNISKLSQEQLYKTVHDMASMIRDKFYCRNTLNNFYEITQILYQ